MVAKILIIEDDKFLGELISKKLKEEGFETIIALDGQEGLIKTEEDKPDLIVLDLLLPGMDGFEVMKRLKQKESTKKIPILILSNLGEREEVEKGLKMGAVDYLIKAHFTPTEIIAKIKLALK